MAETPRHPLQTGWLLQQGKQKCTYYFFTLLANGRAQLVSLRELVAASPSVAPR